MQNSENNENNENSENNEKRERLNNNISTSESNMMIDVSILPTPNPNALKFILNTDLKSQGKCTFRNVSEAQDIPLAHSLFQLPGVDNLHFFQNTVTVTKTQMQSWDELEPLIVTCLEEQAAQHNPHFMEVSPEEIRRKNLSPEILMIEEILDRTIRPGLQSDGGDIVCVDFKNDVLLVRYQGACGTCPSSSSGTLEAIKSILKHELQREIEVYIVPE